MVALGLGLLCFAVAAAAELRPRGVELAALRRQGLRPGSSGGSGSSATRRSASVAVGLGLVTGLVLWLALLPARCRVFADAWPAVRLGWRRCRAGRCLAGRALLRRLRRWWRVARPGAASWRAVRPAVGAVVMVGLTLALLRSQWPRC